MEQDFFLFVVEQDNLFDFASGRRLILLWSLKIMRLLASKVIFPGDFPGVNNLDSLCSFLVALDSSWQFWAAPSIGGAVLASPWEVLGRQLWVSLSSLEQLLGSFGQLVAALESSQQQGAFPGSFGQLWVAERPPLGHIGVLYLQPCVFILGCPTIWVLGFIRLQLSFAGVVRYLPERGQMVRSIIHNVVASCTILGLLFISILC